MCGPIIHFPKVSTMLRLLKKSLLAMFHGLRRPSRRTAPLIVELESRRLLSGQGTDKALVESVRPLAADREIHTPEAAKTNKQIKFVDGLYEKYLHQAPDSAELSYALELLASGVSQAAFKRDFTDIVSKSDKKISNQAFVSALYATIAGHAPTAVGQSYWQGLLASGESRTQVRQMFAGVGRPSSASDDHLGQSRRAITYGTALGPCPIGCHRQRGRYVHLLAPLGHDPRRGQSESVSHLHAQRCDRLYHRHRFHDDHRAPATPTITWA